MLECLKFIFNCVVEFILMLFTIDLGFTNLGVFLSIIAFFFPVVLLVVNVMKYKARGD